VAIDRRTGGTFASIPTCSTAGETGCVIAYRSMPAGGFVAQPDPGYPPGREQMCVNPGNLGDAGTAAALSAIYVEGREYVTYFGLYRARCVRTADRARVLVVEQVPSARSSPIDLHAPELNTLAGTHVFDIELAEESLVELARRAALTWHAR
jgi:hypothetical protein